MTDYRKRKKQKVPLKKTILILAVVLLLGLIFLIAGGGAAFRSSRARSSQIQENVKVLKEMEEKKPEAQNPKETEEKTKAEPEKQVDLTGEEEKIMKLDAGQYNDALTRKWFEDAVILGDSLAQAATEYGYLGEDIILASIGASIESSYDAFDQAIAKNPSTVFMFYGGNDISAYLGEPQKFIDQYKAALEKLQGALPDAVFYLHAILPEQKGVGYEPGYEFRKDYNKALEEFCASAENVNYINADFILEKDPGLYDADGIHPVSAFYPKWLTYLADISGLSAEEDS